MAWRWNLNTETAKHRSLLRWAGFGLLGFVPVLYCCGILYFYRQRRIVSEGLGIGVRRCEVQGA